MITKFNNPKDELDAARRAYVGEHGWDSERFDEAYRGHFENEEAYARHIIAEDGIFRQFKDLERYFDFVGYSLALFRQDYTAVEAPRDNGGIFVFRVL